MRPLRLDIEKEKKINKNTRSLTIIYKSVIQSSGDDL